MAKGPFPLALEVPDSELLYPYGSAKRTQALERKVLELNEALVTMQSEIQATLDSVEATLKVMADQLMEMRGGAPVTEDQVDRVAKRVCDEMDQRARASKPQRAFVYGESTYEAEIPFKMIPPIKVDLEDLAQEVFGLDEKPQKHSVPIPAGEPKIIYTPPFNTNGTNEGA